MGKIHDCLNALRCVSVGKRKLDGPWAVIISVIAIAMALLLLWFNSYGMVLGVQLRAIHLGFVLPLVFLAYPLRKKAKRTTPSPLDILLAIASILCLVHMYMRYETFSTTGATMTQTDFAIGVIGILLICEATRRTAGWSLVLLSAFFLFYARFGNLFPGGFRIVPFSTNRIVYTMFYTDTSIFGTVLGVSATYIFLFVLFGAFLGENKSSEFFTDLALAAAGDKPGGPGKVAVLSSALMGSVSGSAVANVATTGTITIPLMKRVGYKAHFAGAVEAVASTGGQILPPVMASAAFIMAEMLGVSYLTVIKAALIPAVLYYVACWIMLDIEARKNNLVGLPKEELPNLKVVLKTRGHLALPLLILIVLLVMGKTPLFAGFWGIISTIIISSLNKETRMSPKTILLALREGTMSALSVAMPCAIVGIIVGVCSMTGVGVMMAGNIIRFANGNVLLAAVLTMLACVILGMGLPTAACYITAAVVIAPALVQMNVNPVVAHMFVLYYSVLSSLTPPVALASFTAAGIADTSVTKTSFSSLKLGLTGFIVPYIFLFANILLLQGNYTALQLIWTVITALIGVLVLSMGLQKYCYKIGGISYVECFLYLAAAICIMIPGVATDLIGVAAITILIAGRMIWKRRKESV